MKKILIGSDEKTYLTDEVVKYLKSKGHVLELAGHLKNENKKWKWVEIGKDVGEKIAKGEAEVGILFCWSGTGVCIAANRVKRVRAVLCWDSETARLARKWDNANILCISLRFTSESLAKEIIDAFLESKFDEEDLNQVEKIDD